MSFLAGQEVEADDLNPPAGKLSLSADQSVPDNTDTQILVNTVNHNYRSVTDAANNRLVIPVTGLWQVTFNLRWTSNATGNRAAWVHLNGVTTIVQENMSGVSTTRGGTTHSLTVDVDLTSGDLLTAHGWQSSGAALNVLTNFSGTHLSARLIRV